MSYVEHLVTGGADESDAAASTVPSGLCGVAHGFNWCSLPPFHAGPHRALGDGGREIDSWINPVEVEQVAS